MSVHIFADESKAHGFLLAAAIVTQRDLGPLRSEVGALRLRGQRRLHFAKESDRRRKEIIRRFTALDVRALIYDATGHRDGKVARDIAIAQLTEDAVTMGAARLVLELDDSAARSDRLAISERLVKIGDLDTLRYEHCRAHQEPLLAIPDAVAWCWARGGPWRRAATSLVTNVIAL